MFRRLRWLVVGLVFAVGVVVYLTLSELMP